MAIQLKRNIKQSDLPKGWSYPYLMGKYEIRTYQHVLDKDAEDEIDLNDVVTIRMPKDNGHTDILIFDKNGHVINPGPFYESIGLEIVKKTDAKTFKRLSRVFRLSLAWRSYNSSDVRTVDLDVNKDLWDGIQLVTKRFVQRHIAGNKTAIKQFKDCGRVQFTLVSDKGEAKGDALIVDSIPGYPDADIGIPKGSYKKELRLTNGTVFVDMRPIKAHNYLMSDIQTLINLHHPLFGSDRLIKWLHDTSVLFLESMKTHPEEKLRNFILHMDEDDEETVMDFPLWRYLASGGELSWSPYFTKQWGNQWKKKLVNRTAQRMRFPIAVGFTTSLTCASAGAMSIPSGHVMIDFATSSFFVSDDDYEEVASICGGGDQDDKMNAIAYRHEDQVILVASRSPNQFCQYIRKVCDNPQELIDHGVAILNEDLDSRLPSTPKVKYGHLVASRMPDFHNSYTAFANYIIEHTADRMTVLGQHINALTACVLTFGREPLDQPATAEDVIDAQVKDLSIDVTPVQNWDKKIAFTLSNYPLCLDAQRRIRGFVGNKDLETREDHWLDCLIERVHNHIEWFDQQVGHIASQAALPDTGLIAVDDCGLKTKWKSMASEFAKFMAEGGHLPFFIRLKFNAMVDEYDAYFDTIQDKDEAVKSLIAMSLIDGYDAPIWQGKVMDKTIDILDDLGIMHKPYEDGHFVPQSPSYFEPQRRVTIFGVWFNIYRIDHPRVFNMRDVPKAVRDELKLNIKRNAHRLVGRKVKTIKVPYKDEERSMIFSDNGTMLGYLAKGQIMDDEVVVLQADANDGNLTLVVERVF